MRKNIKTVKLNLTEQGVKKFLNVPTFKNTLHPEQLKALIIGENTLNVNHFIFSTLKRIVLYDSNNMQLIELN
jgi:hypothetical protein